MRLLTGYLLLLHGAAALNVGPDYSHPIEGRMPGPVSISKLIESDLDVDLPFSQPVTFAHLEWQRCLSASFDKARI